MEGLICMIVAGTRWYLPVEVTVCCCMFDGVGVLRVEVQFEHSSTGVWLCPVIRWSAFGE